MTMKTCVAAAALAMTAGLAAAQQYTIITLPEAVDPSDTYDHFTFEGNEIPVGNGGATNAAKYADRWTAWFSTVGEDFDDQVLLVGEGTSFEVVAWEAISNFADGAGLSLSNNVLGSPGINDAGQIGFAFTPTDRGTGASPADLLPRTLVLYKDTDGQYYTYTTGVAGDTASHATDGTSGTLAGVYFRSNIDNDGEITFIDVGFDANGLETSALIINDNELAFAELLNVAAGQNPASTTRTATDIDGLSGGVFVTNDFAIDATGDNWIIEVDLDTADEFSLPPFNGSSTGDAIIVNNVVVAQEGQILDPANTGFVAPISSVDNPAMAGDGTYAFEISNADGINAAVKFDGTKFVVIAEEGQPIIPGSTEVWETITDVFMAGDGLYIVTGRTDAPTASDMVAVYMSRAVVARENDPVADLTGDGQPDIFLDGDFGQSTQQSMTTKGYYFRTDVNDANDSVIVSADGLFRATLPCNAADLAAPYAVLNFADVQSFLGAFGGNIATADLAAPAGVFNFADVQTFLGLFGAGCN